MVILKDVMTDADNRYRLLCYKHFRDSDEYVTVRSLQVKAAIESIVEAFNHEFSKCRAFDE